MSNETKIEGFVFIDNDSDDLRFLCLSHDERGPVITLKRWSPNLDTKEICIYWEQDVFKYLYSCNHYSRIGLSQAEIARLIPTPATMENEIIYI